ncbi:GNAT family N-acetyltransferase [Ciceribacter ferrooxidans]|uniref:GNAT family N-acetyltransferase n=1 Tax=Ciceribacter ferrooxidans TaxID=2509717 RepID=A0A4Q2TJC1_9HYPH|nr:GNAT family N-acetyltransferase [Ciceribacter ferrooxidans]RYC17625.1 GNAT family N-acetyltransferase [Ciceribacter ferrooxidans]
MQVDVASTFDELDAWKDDWERVHAADGEAHCFLSWAWMRRWLERRSPWLVLAARRTPPNHGYVAFLPIQLRISADDTGLFNLVLLGGAPFAGYCGMIAVPEEAEAALDAFAAFLQDEVGWRHFVLDDVLMSELRLKRLLDAFPQAEFTHGKVKRAAHVTAGGDSIDHDVYVYVPLADDYEDFLSEKLGARTRRHARKALRLLDDPEQELKVTLPTADTLAESIDTFCELWRRQWWDLRPTYGEFILESARHMLPACFEAGMLHMPILRHRGSPVAAFVILLDPSRRTMVGFLSGRDLSFDRSVSPGLILHCHSIRWGIENGYRIYDLGTGDYSYKDSFGSEHRIVEKYRVSTRDGQNIGGRLDPRTVDEALARTAALAREGKLALAATCCAQVIAAAPTDPRASALAAEIDKARHVLSERRFAAATALLRADSLADAERALLEVVDLSPRHAGALQALALLRLRKGDFDGAIRHIDEAIAVLPGSAPAHFCRGNILVRQGRFGEALESYERAVALDGNHAPAFNNRGTLLYRMGRREEAIDSYRRALAIDPGFVSAADNLERACGERHAVPVQS